MSDTFSPFAPSLTDEEKIARGREIFEDIIKNVPSKKETIPILAWVIVATSGELPMMFFKEDKTWSGDVKDAKQSTIDECVVNYTQITQEQNYPSIYQGAETKIDIRPLIVGPGGMVKL